MKKTSKKILSVVLAIVTLLSFTVIASAKATKPLGYIEGVPVKAKYTLDLGQTLTISAFKGATSYSAWFIGDNDYSVTAYCEEGKTPVLFAKEEGVALFEIRAYKDYTFFEDGEEYSDFEILDDYYIIIAVRPYKEPNFNFGEVTGLYMPDVELNYKEESYIYPDIYTSSDYAYCCTYFVNHDYTCADLWEDGTIGWTYAKGKDNCTCYVVDAEGNIYSEDFSITVKYSFIQWIIRILLFGWIWY